MSSLVRRGCFLAVDTKKETSSTGSTHYASSLIVNKLFAIFRKKLEQFVTDGTLTHLHVAFSRDEGQAPDAPRYVQHNIKQHGAALTELIMKRKASIFVCGYVVWKGYLT